MKMNFRIIAVLLLISSCSSPGPKDGLVGYVDPNIGGIGHLLVATAPIVQLPHGMVELSYNHYPEIADRYLAEKISSFSLRALPRYETKTIPSWIMATTGDVKVLPEEMASGFDHDFEVVKPYYASIRLDDHKVKVEYSASEKCGFYRFTFSESLKSNIVFGTNFKIEIPDSNTVQGEEYVKGVKSFFYAIISRPFTNSVTWRGKEIFSESKMQMGDSIGAALTFRTKEQEVVDVKIGISYINIDQAKANLLKEIDSETFNAVKENARKVWNKSLEKIKVKGGTEKERVIFYTALYRAMLGSQAINLNEQGRYFSRFDSTVHKTNGHDFYRLGSNWGSHHSLFPLLALLEPQRQLDLMHTYYRMQQQGGWLENSGGRHNMIGHHEAATIADIYFKGFRDFDVKVVYEALKKNALEMTMLSRHLGPASSFSELDQFYKEKGFFPALSPGEKEWVPEVGFGRQSVSVTLENSYDDWCIAQLAKDLGKQDDYEYFLKRSKNYKNVFDSSIGFMRPKAKDGAWIAPFDPIWSGGQGGRDYFTENNSWNYTWFVPHDIEGLIQLMGGKERFKQKLDALFTTTVSLYKKFEFLSRFPDMTGWIGMYSHGNEITWHIPYLYNYVGAPWMTQKRVREIMKLWYGAGPLGYCGDEDYGEMASWYVLSALGLYQVCPGKPVYDIGSPIFKTIEIDVGEGKRFIIRAPKTSPSNKYVQEAVLNGRKQDNPWINHSDIIKGGELVLEMGSEPNTEWGSGGIETN